MSNEHVINTSASLDRAHGLLLQMRSYYLRVPQTPAIQGELALLSKMLEAAAQLSTFMTMLVDGYMVDAGAADEVNEFCALVEESAASGDLRPNA